MKKIFLVVFLFVHLYGYIQNEFCYQLIEKQPSTSTSISHSSSKEDYTLISSFGFYKGQYPMELIRTIIFSHEPPDNYDEEWDASITGNKKIKGYRMGEEVYIVGDQIFASNRCSCMFAAQNSYGDPLWLNLQTIKGLSLLDVSNVTSMKMMFAYTQVKDLSEIENWDVSNVKNFTAMFQGNDNSGDVPIKILPVQNWDTSSATSMAYMFYGCAQIEEFLVDNWDVSKVENFSHMFADCYALKELDLSKWDTARAVSFDAFLNDCRSLESIDVSALNVSNCRQFSQMFENCWNLKEIKGINSWDVSQASYYAFSETFHNCYDLKALDLSTWKARPDNTARMFKNCYSLEFLDVSGLDLSGAVTDEMYNGCENLKNK